MATVRLSFQNRVPAFFGVILAVVLAAVGADSATAGLEVTIEPGTTMVTGGTVFDVEIVAGAGGVEFNGFDLEIGYDPTMLTYVDQPKSALAGSLMTDACSSFPFHLFQVSTDSTRISASYIMLCSGVSATGPGVVYNLRFQAKHQSGVAELQFLDNTFFYDAGVRVEPLVTFAATVLVDYESAVDEAPVYAKSVLQAAPNPFNPSTRISFELKEAGWVTLKVFDARGCHVRSLVDSWRAEGRLEVVWNGADSRGRRQPGGVYLFVLDYGTRENRRIAAKKATLVP